jgi:hypothetical protein
MDASGKYMNTEKSEKVDYVPKEGTTWPIMGAPRRISVKGAQGVNATVAVTVVQDTVRLSISPPFTWEAITEPGKVDEVISMLELARDEAKRAAAARNESALRGAKAAVRAITKSGSATQ